jgi:hypothetical protein
MMKKPRRRATIVWAGAATLALVAFVWAPLAFNRATPLILGLPPLYFWFVAATALEPVIMGLVYWVDRAETGPGEERAREESSSP